MDSYEYISKPLPNFNATSYTTLLHIFITMCVVNFNSL